MKCISLLTFILILNCLSLASQNTTKQIFPNVLLIVLDDLGWNDVGYHGSEIQTPTIDRLVAEGVELDRFYVHSSCTPTRSSLMTGKTAVRLGIVNPIAKNNKLGLPLSEKILPQYFKEKGYSTSLIGKWHLGRYQKEYWPYHRGFDHFYGNLTGGVGHYDHVHGGAIDWQRNGETIIEEGYSTHLLTDETVKVLKAKEEKPFFIVLSYAAPHMPNEAPKESVAIYSHLKNQNRQLHAAMVTEVDKGIQTIVETLEETGLIDNTIIWFMSDNGGKNLEGTPKKLAEPILKFARGWGTPLPFPFFEFLRNNMINGAGSNKPLKGGKATVYEGGIRVPSFIYAPKFIPQQSIHHQITVNDVLPTLATVLGMESLPDSTIDGVSQWQYLRKEAGAPENTYVSAGKWGQAYFKKEWKLIVSKDGQTELYKILEDPKEQTNLADEYPGVVATLTAELLAFPKGQSIDDPLWKVFLDTDKFGGAIDRAPYAGLEGNISAPLHSVFYLLGMLVFIIFIALIYLIRRLFKFK